MPQLPGARPDQAEQEGQDRAWLERVAQERDQEAFNGLLQHHGQALYALALDLTRCPEEAAEAFQNALLRVWTGAQTYRRDGAVRSWLFRVLCREALRRNRSVRRHRQLLQRSARQPPASPERPSGEVSLNGETHAALRSAYQELPEEDRRILALCFVAQLSQREIGELLGVSQSSVHRRQDQALALLRQGLLRGGHAELGLGGLGPWLWQALEGQTPDYRQALDRGFWSRLEHSAERCNSGTAFLPLPLSWAKWAWGGVLLSGALCAGGLLWLEQSSSSGAPGGHFSAAVPPVVGLRSAGAEGRSSSDQNFPRLEGSFRKVWTFHDPHWPEDFQLYEGAFRFCTVPAPPLRHLGAARGGSWSSFFLKYRIPKLPVVFHFTCRSDGLAEQASLGVQRTNGRDCLPYTLRLEKGAPGITASQRYLHSFYFAGRLGMALREGVLLTVSEYAEVEGSDIFMVNVKNWLLERIEVASIGEEDLPPAVREALKAP